MSDAVFDLIYVSGPEGRTMSCGIVNAAGETELVGPYPAAEAGPAIVRELLVRPEFGFADKEEAEDVYIAAHFRNMRRGENDAGQAYPFKVQP